MKILITTEQFPPMLSGVSLIVFGLVESLLSKGHEVTVVTQKDPKRSMAHHPKLIIKEFDIQGGFGTYYRGEVNEYIQFVLNNQNQYDVMINECVQTWNSDLLFPFLSQLKMIKILHSHGFSLLHQHSKNPWANIKAKWYYRKLPSYLAKYDCILILSKLSIEKLFLDNHQLTHYMCFPNAVFRDFCATKPKILINQKHLLLSISNFFPQKNQEFILNAFYKIKTPAQMVFIGTAQLHGYLEKLKKLKKQLDEAYGYKEVFFYESLSREETVYFMQKATLFLHGSLLEAFPVVILEAMATATPWICTDVGNVKELEGGMIICCKKEMSMSIDLLLNDKTYYESLSSKALSCVQQYYQWDIIVEQLESLFITLKEQQ